MDALERRILAAFKRKIVARFPGAETILFGSRARGDADPDSDMDVLVILDGAASPKDVEAVSESAWEACLGQGIVLTPVVVSRQEWENGIVSSSLLAIAVAEDGVRV